MKDPEGADYIYGVEHPNDEDYGPGDEPEYDEPESYALTRRQMEDHYREEREAMEETRAIQRSGSPPIEFAELPF